MNARYLVVSAVVALGLAAASLPASAQNPGNYSSALRPGMNSGVQIGRASTSRQFPNSGNPKIFNGQSWSGSVLGAQWEIKCGVETTITPPDYSLYNPGTGTGVITFHQTFNGGTFTLYSDPSMPVNWVSTPSVSGTLGVTSVISQVQLISFIPVASSFTGSTSGHFENGCTMNFAMANGFGVGETSDPPGLTKPATYPAFLAADCSPADGAHQFGTWGDVNDIIVSINADCATPTRGSTWGRIKSMHR
jgi:hypothetical protein